MQKILIEISHQNQIFVEEECTKKGHSLSSFFELLLDQYRSPVSKLNSDQCNMSEQQLNAEIEPKNDLKEEIDKPKRGRKKKTT